MEVYWDKLAWAPGLPGDLVKTQRLSLSEAALRYRGFSLLTQDGPSSPELAHYETLARTGQQWRNLEGYYTRYGDVRELLELVPDPVQLLVTDVVMPEMSGGQLAELMRSRFPSCRILFMSGYNEDTAGRHGRLGRNDAFLQKPFTPLSLARKVRKTLDQPC